MKNTITNYSNATHVKLKNRRMFIEDLENGDVGICLKRLCSKEEATEPSCRHRVERGVIKVTSLRLSEEGAWSLFMALMERFKTKQEIVKL